MTASAPATTAKDSGPSIAFNLGSSGEANGLSEDQLANSCGDDEQSRAPARSAREEQRGQSDDE